MSDAIAFARSLYDWDAIRAAVDAFDDLARFEIEDRGAEIFVKISEPDGDVAHLADEFGNYVLVETVTRRAERHGAPK